MAGCSIFTELSLSPCSGLLSAIVDQGQIQLVEKSQEIIWGVGREAGWGGTNLTIWDRSDLSFPQFDIQISPSFPCLKFLWFLHKIQYDTPGLPVISETYHFFSPHLTLLYRNYPLNQIKLPSQPPPRLGVWEYRGFKNNKQDMNTHCCPCWDSGCLERRLLVLFQIKLQGYLCPDTVNTKQRRDSHEKIYHCLSQYLYYYQCKHN